MGEQNVKPAENVTSVAEAEQNDFDVGFAATEAVVTQPVQNVSQPAPEQNTPAVLELTPSEQPVPPVPQEAPVTPQTIPVDRVEIDETIREEFAALEALSPQAAAVAREDSKDGLMLRKRLAEWGADQALDRAELILDRRDRAVQAARAEQDAVAAHNRYFQSTLQADHPELFTPSRTAEDNARFMASMRQWIESRPYAEARPLMDVFEHGRDPRQVSALITAFNEGTATASRTRGHAPDPTAALAVTGRGAPLVPANIGGRDDFDAGWNL